MFTYAQLLVWDIIRFNWKNYEIVYKKWENNIIRNHDEFLENKLDLSITYEFVTHIDQEYDFKDKKWNVLRTWMSFIDSDNNDKEENWKLWIVVFDSNGEEEISYTQKEFNEDCEINMSDLKEIQKLKELEEEANKILQKKGKSINLLSLFRK